MEINPRCGTPDFKWQGWLKDFLGLKFSIPNFFFFFWGGGGGGGLENLGSFFLGWGFWGVFKIQNLPTQVIAIRFVNSLKRDENFSPAKCKIGVSTSKLDHYCFLLGPDLWSLNNCNQKRNNNHYQPLIICHYCL